MGAVQRGWQPGRRNGEGTAATGREQQPLGGAQQRRGRKPRAGRGGEGRRHGQEQQPRLGRGGERAGSHGRRAGGEGMAATGRDAQPRLGRGGGEDEAREGRAPAEKGWQPRARQQRGQGMAEREDGSHGPGAAEKGRQPLGAQQPRARCGGERTEATGGHSGEDTAAMGRSSSHGRAWQKNERTAAMGRSGRSRHMVLLRTHTQDPETACGPAERADGHRDRRQEHPLGKGEGASKWTLRGRPQQRCSASLVAGDTQIETPLPTVDKMTATAWSRGAVGRPPLPQDDEVTGLWHSSSSRSPRPGIEPWRHSRRGQPRHQSQGTALGRARCTQAPKGDTCSPGS